MVILGHLPHKRGMAGGRAIKFRFIQALRGIAAALVVLYHAAEGGHIPALMAVLPAPAAALFHHGWIGVPIFFALSGFVIAYSVSGQAIGWGFFGRFILRRSVRLDPPYWVSIGLVVAIGALSAWVKAEAFDLPTPGQLLSHITYTQVLLGYPPINDVYWTLTYEVQFYLVLVLALLVQQRMARNMGQPVSGGIIFGGLLIMALWNVAVMERSYVPGLFIDLWASFFGGVLAFWALSDRRAATALVALALVTLVYGSDPQRCSLITASLLYAVGVAGKLEHGLANRWFQGLGAISYSLYLIHNPVQGAAFFVARKILPGGAAGEAIQLVVASVACIAAAALLWWLVEQPSQALAKRWGRRPAGTPPPTV